MANLVVRKAGEGDFPEIWKIFRLVVEPGDTYAYAPETSREEAHVLLMEPPSSSYVALAEGRVVGTFALRPNKPGLGSHVANAGFMVDPEARRMGVGRRMAEFALAEAARLGYLAMQFNFVVSTNLAALALWRGMGFRIMATLPKAFRHKRLGLVDVYVMHRFLD